MGFCVSDVSLHREGVGCETDWETDRRTRHTPQSSGSRPYLSSPVRVPVRRSPFTTFFSPRPLGPLAFRGRSSLEGGRDCGQGRKSPFLFGGRCDAEIVNVGRSDSLQGLVGPTPEETSPSHGVHQVRTQPPDSFVERSTNSSNRN